MSRTYRSIALLTFALLIAGGGAPLRGATWNNIGSDWTTAGNWTGGVPTNNDTAVLPSSATPVNPNLASSQTVAGLTIDNTAGSYNVTQTGTPSLTLRYGGLQVTGGGATSIAPNVIISGGQNWNVGTATVTLQGNLTIGNGDSFQKAGSGTLNIQGTFHLGNPQSQFVNTAGTTRVQGVFDSNGNSPQAIVNGGSLLVNSTGGNNNQVTVSLNGGTLGGIGAVGAVTANGGATLAPGDPGTGYQAGLLQTQSLISNGAGYIVDIGGLTPGDGGFGFHDQLSVTGTVTLNGGPLTVNLFDGFTPNYNQQFTIITSTGTRSGTFNGLADGAVFTQAGQQWRINYFTNSVVLTAVPEPTTLAFLGVSALGCLGYAWRRRAVSG